ncbi:MAG TPA: VWA domain-containing protein [Candidatus Hydrogenedens sp.]|nr:VWA domain-containing protein [Candidatus Hydrogenedens sp.]HOK08053.1 VWA domain-containing protein [Candidatus Hydrogenedens sp.]HOL19353.1 VWA domain-containing protein [Candidatus Hydrogenedens sp.]HPP57953.1 VWA domain-containing protein [Candidatus Hydrogenedens sp.]
MSPILQNKGMFFTYPYMFLLLIPVFILFLLQIRKESTASIVFSTNSLVSQLVSYTNAWRKFIAPLLSFIAFIFFIIALAGPTYGVKLNKDRANVIDIMLCLDISGSMSQQDYVLDRRPRDRLFVAKKAAMHFIEHRKEKKSNRFGLDRIGLILYAGLAWTRCPLTLDYEVLLKALDKTDFAPQEKDGTAIGSALGLAVRRLSESEAKSKVVILLTDGINNRGDITPLEAVEMAKEKGIKVYTIGAGTSESGLSMTAGGMIIQNQPIDEALLQKIAEDTGGKYYRATDTEGLLKAYDEISQLEATEVDIGDFYEYEEVFLPFVIIGTLFMLGSVYSRRILWDPLP